MDETTQSKVMEEILGSVSMLAQDQYGNYVVQVCNFLRKFKWSCHLVFAVACRYSAIIFLEESQCFCFVLDFEFHVLLDISFNLNARPLTECFLCRRSMY